MMGPGGGNELFKSDFHLFQYRRLGGGALQCFKPCGGPFQVSYKPVKVCTGLARAVFRPGPKTIMPKTCSKVLLS